MKYGRFLGPVFALLMAAGCTGTSHPSKSLMVMLQDKGTQYQVTQVKVLDRPYKSSRQQGHYQVHLLDRSQHVIQKIGFDDIALPQASAGNAKVDLQFILPLKKGLHQIAVYKLDGSSGHYQLNEERPLVRWILPDSLSSQRSRNEQ